MCQNIFIMQDEIKPPSWLEAFPDSIIHESVPEPLPEKAFVWLLAGSLDWCLTIERCVKVNIPVIVLTNKLDIKQLTKSLQYGAKGYVNLNVNSRTLQQIRETILHGGIWVPEQLLLNLSSVLLTTPSNYKSKNKLKSLTEREIQVVHEVIKGLTNKQIARILDITERTVKEHMTSILRKLDLRNRRQLILSLK
jgi:DNA-binding NarL/FixJ family response regulator